MAYNYYGGYPNWQPTTGGFYPSPAQNQFTQGAQQFQPANGMQMQNANMQNQAQAQPNNNGIIWVQGEEGAKAFIVAPGNTVQLWDSENPTIYIKSADASGVPSMRILDWTERTAAPKMPVQPAQPTVEYVTRAEFDNLVARIDLLTQPKQTARKTAKKEVTEDA